MVQQAIEVGAPLHTVYEQLAKVENYPRFMHGVERVTEIGADQTHWVMDLDGYRREFDATITERSPDERLSWSTTDGPLLAETLTLRPIGETRTQVVAQIEADIAFLLPSDRHGQETLNRRLKADLDTFKSLCENGKFGTHLDAGASSKQLSGRSSTIFGSAPPADPASAAARVRAGRPNAHPGAGWGIHTLDDNPDIRGADPAGPPGTADMGLNVDITSAPGIKDAHDLDDVLAPGRRIGGAGSIRGGAADARGATAPMGGQAMSPKDNWGDGMINEEDRGSA
jgi:ribosome-associated toxin RatA of RatAB toxin-antitoxin module